jgi:hypothetical protein
MAKRQRNEGWGNQFSLEERSEIIIKVKRVDRRQRKLLPLSGKTV